MKKCCKNCKRLAFWDWYLCEHSKERHMFISDIETTKCKYYKRGVNNDKV